MIYEENFPVAMGTQKFGEEKECREIPLSIPPRKVESDRIQARKLPLSSVG